MPLFSRSKNQETAQGAPAFNPRTDAGSLRGGVDLGGTKIQALIVDSESKVLGRARAATPHEGGPPAVIEAIATTVSEALAGSGADASQLSGIGIGSPGSVDHSTGTVSNASNLPDWIEPYPMGPEISARFGGLPVVLGNDVDVAVNAEFQLGAGRPFPSVLGVWWGTGVGGGVILNGVNWVGRGFAGEFGHQVIERGGARCGCGNRGCVEAYAGRKDMQAWVASKVEDGGKTKLFKIAKHKHRDSLTSGVWARAIRDDDKLAERAVRRATRALGAGIASSINLLDLPAVVVGGGMGERFFVDRQAEIAKYMEANLFRREDPPALLATELGDDGGAIGAALLLLPGS